MSNTTTTSEASIPVKDEVSPKSTSRVRTVSKTYYCASGSYQQDVRSFVGDDMDRYLAELGFVKRIVPKDGNSLYRCISELLCLNQCNFLPIKNMIEDHVQLQYKLQQLEHNENIVDRTMDRLIAASLIYRIKIIIYRGRTEPKIIGADYDKELTLCEISPNCYERVYKKNLQVPLAICQTFLYQCLYEHVINVPKTVIQEAIIQVRLDIDSSGKDPSTASTPLPIKTSVFSFCPCNKTQQPSGYRPPIPYSAVKSLDPAIYRNIAYDLYAKDKRRAVLDDKKEKERKCDDRFPVGSVCMARDGRDILRAKVISVLPDNHRCIRFENGTEKNVIVSDLRSVVSQVITPCSLTTPDVSGNTPTQRVSILEPVSYNVSSTVPVSFTSVPTAMYQQPTTYYINQPFPAFQPIMEKHVEHLSTNNSHQTKKEEMDRDAFAVGKTCLVRDGKDFVKAKIISNFPDNSKCVRFENGSERKVLFGELRPLLSTSGNRDLMVDPININSSTHSLVPAMASFPIQHTPPFPPGFHLPPLNIPPLNMPPPNMVKGVPAARLMSSPKQSSSYYVPPFDPNVEKTTWWQPPANMQCSPRLSVGHRPMYGTSVSAPLVVRKLEACSMPVTPIYPTPPPCSDRDLSSVFVSPVRSQGFPKKNVPYIDYENVNRVIQTVDFSKKEDGSDLPDDILTLRYFFNMGVMTFRNGYEFMNSSLDRESMSSAISNVSVPPPSAIPLPVFPEHVPIPVDASAVQMSFDCSMPPPYPQSAPPQPNMQHQQSVGGGGNASAPAVPPTNYTRYIPMNAPMPVCVNGTFYYNSPLVSS